MKIIDPACHFGIDSGLRTLVVTKRERAALLRAVTILETGHELINQRNPDHQGDGDDIADALCLAPAAIRQLAEEGFDL